LNRVTGSQLHAARVLVGLSREDLAERAGLCRHSIRARERSSNSIPEATYSHLCRAVEALEATGVRFSDSGVYLQRASHQLRTIARVYTSPMGLATRRPSRGRIPREAWAGAPICEGLTMVRR
jgi:transcriptional regulator with XRE-family HTH domain